LNAFVAVDVVIVDDNSYDNVAAADVNGNSDFVYNTNSDNAGGGD